MKDYELYLFDIKIKQVAVLPNLRLWTIQLWMIDSEMNVLKSSDRLKQEANKK